MFRYSRSEFERIAANMNFTRDSLSLYAANHPDGEYWSVRRRPN